MHHYLKTCTFAFMNKLFNIIIILISFCSSANAQNDILSYVDPIIGTGKSTIQTAGIYGVGTEVYAHTLPAVLFPNGMTFWTPQTRHTEQKCVSPYYYEDTQLQGIRTSHWIVGGCTQDYGSFTICPSNNKGNNLPSSAYSHESEISTPAYYSAYLQDYGIKMELTGKSRSAIIRFTYKNPKKAYIYITCNSDEDMGTVEVMSDKKSIKGRNHIHRIYQGWGEEAGYSGWLALQTDAKIEEFGRLDNNTIWLHVIPNNNEVLVKCANSFTSYDSAKKNLLSEIPSWNFDAVRSELEDVWRNQLSKIIISDCNDNSLLTSFYTSFYHASFLPHDISDVDGCYPAFANGKDIMNSPTGYYDDYSVWDTYRALHPLLNIITPSKAGNMMQSLVDKYEQGGWMPIFPCWNSYTAAMIGDHCASLFADAYIKGIRNFDYNKAYEGARKNAFESPSDYEEYKNGMGRRALRSYLDNGYIPMSDSVAEAFHKKEQVSRTLEYAYDDYCLSQLSKALGKADDYRHLISRSANYRNVIRPEFSMMKDRVDWITEGAPCHYMWYVPQDPQGLINLLGGKNVYLEKLDSMFSQGYYWHGNEPCHQVAYMYNYAGEQWKTARTVRKIMHEEYQTGAGGLAGNDDAGQMSAWYIFSALGLYPVCPGSDEYAIGSPVFPKVQIALENGKTFTVIAKNVSPKNIFIQSAKLNGIPLYAPFITHKSIVSGYTLELVMGPHPNKEWGLRSSVSNIYNVMDFGAKGDGKSDDAEFIQAAIDEASKNKGMVLLPAGHVFMSSPLELKSDIDFHVEATATLIANPDESVYKKSAFGENIGEGMLWLYANGANNLTISGKGTIDGNGVAFMGTELDDSYELKELPTLNRKEYKRLFGQDTDYFNHHKEFPFDPRPHLLTLFGCFNTEIKDVTIQNGAYWTVHLVGCLYANIHDIALLNNLKIRNGDGIDLDHTQNVHIHNCFITSGDDCVCLKNRREYSEGYTKGYPFISPDGIVMLSQKCGNILVEDCHMTSRSCTIKIGSENVDSIYNVIFANCSITASNRGLGIQNRDEGTVTDILFTNIKQDCRLFSDVWWGKAEPIYVTSYPRAVGNHKDAGWRFPKGVKEGKCGKVSHVVFNNVECISENGSFIGGDEVGKVSNIIFKDVDMTFKRFTDYPLGVYDRRPCLGEGFIKDRTHAVVIDNADVSGAETINVKFDKSFTKDNYGEKIFYTK